MNKLVPIGIAAVASRVPTSTLRRLSRSFSRKVKGSRNRARARLKLARLHEKIANVRQDSLHQLSASITRRFHTIGIEDLDVKGMMANSRLARAIADMGFHELRRQLAYKSAWRGGQVVIVARWFPSSKLCSCCGYEREALDLGTRQWTCSACGRQHDRDVNAAINLRKMALSSTVSACGGDGAGRVPQRAAKPAPMKQESNGSAGSAQLCVSLEERRGRARPS